MEGNGGEESKVEEERKGKQRNCPKEKKRNRRKMKVWRNARPRKEGVEEGEI